MFDREPPTITPPNATALRRLVDSASVLIWMADTEKQCTYFNPAWLRFRGRSLEEEYGFGWAEGVHPDDFDRCLEIYTTAFDAREAFSMDYRLKCHDGSYRWIRDDGAPSYGDAGEFEGYVGSCFDITEMIEAQEAAARMHQAEKLEAIGQLAGGIAHDFNNQLACIQGFAELLMDRTEDQSLSRYADNIFKAAHYASDLTGKLLTFARKGRVERKVIDVHQAINDAVSMLKRTIDRKIQLSTRLEAASSNISGDPSHIHNAILNLALNARDAMPEGGTLTFSTSTAHLSESEGDLQPGDYIHIAVTDTGCGMDDEIRAHLFEPFYTSKGGKGTGLGLPSVYGTIIQHRGSISVDSEPGAGTTFQIRLPLNTEDRATDSNRRSSARLDNDSFTVLVVDDEPMLLRLTEEILREAGHTVLLAGNGAEAIECFRKHANSIDLILMDSIMPVMTGPEAFEQLRAINPEVKVIAASGYSTTGSGAKGFAATADAFIAKPFDIADLLDTIQRVGRKS